ncbi:ribonuclease HII [Cellulomonas cellasea]|uniref:Ribonuclease n=1 Tax=Cellulomonas cellasea TaxID=43670 RepID=A0A7W4YDX3_9CELL|nr:ribonuclease HII [Cellulomonas cellasea]MBB2925016.1 ribonuclease HII [Cellulomonas cellasea]
MTLVDLPGTSPAARPAQRDPLGAALLDDAPAHDDLGTGAPTPRPSGPRTPASRAAAPRTPAARTAPTLRHERTLLRSGAVLVAGMDEVGRGALAGPVSVGVVVVDARTRACPPGVTDSKLLSPAARSALVPALRRWGIARAVGHASSDEIDAIGIIAALRLAGSRALRVVAQQVGPVDAVVLDGSHNWLTPPAQGALFEADPEEHADAVARRAAADEEIEALGFAPRVRMMVKADRTCASVAAASVLAKCERDETMTTLAREHPLYGWESNKGYGSSDHVAALRLHGPSPLHRVSWRLPLDECTAGG